MPSYSKQWSPNGPDASTMSRQSCVGTVGDVFTFNFTLATGEATTSVTGSTFTATLSSHQGRGLVKAWGDAAFSAKTSGGAFTFTTASLDTAGLASRAWVLEINITGVGCIAEIWFTLNSSGSFDEVPTSDITLLSLLKGGTASDLSATGPGVAIQATAGAPLTISDYAAFRVLIGAGTSSFDGAFSSLSGKPTTLSGYGITDAWGCATLISGNTRTVYPAAANTDVARGTALLAAIAAATSNDDTVTLSPGVFNIATSRIDLSRSGTGRINLFGAGVGATTITSTFNCDAGINPSEAFATIRLGTACELAWLTVYAVDPMTGSGFAFPVGVASNDSAACTTVTINGSVRCAYVHDVRINGHTDGIYFRHASACTAVFERVECNTNFDAFAVISAGANEAHNITLRDCKLFAVGPNTNDATPTTSRAVSLRTGTLTAYNCLFSCVNGGATVNDAIFVTGAAAIAYLYGCRTYTSNGSDPKFDLRQASSGSLSVDVATVYDTAKTSGTITHIATGKINGNTWTAGTGTLTLSTFTVTASGNATISGTHSGTSSGVNTGDQDLSSYATSAALTAALAAYVGSSNVVTVGTLTGGATGAGFTIALATSTVTGSLALANGGTVGYVLNATFTASGASSATLAVITDGTTPWSFALAAATKYYGRAVIVYTCVADVGFKLAFSATNSLTVTRWSRYILDMTDALENWTTSGQYPGSNGTLTQTYTAGVAASQTGGTLAIDFEVVTNAAGTLNLTFASAADNNTATLTKGHIELRKATN